MTYEKPQAEIMNFDSIGFMTSSGSSYTVEQAYNTLENGGFRGQIVRIQSCGTVTATSGHLTCSAVTWETIHPETGHHSITHMENTSWNF